MLKRRLFNVLTLLSLALCALFSGTWVYAWWQVRAFMLPFVGAGNVHVHDTHVVWGWVLPLLVSLTAVLPLSWLLVLLGSLDLRRRRPGLCSTCGYDLTGNASGVCPECGTTVIRES